MPMGLKRVVVMKGLKGLESDYVICAMKKCFEPFDSSVLRKAIVFKGNLHFAGLAVLFRLTIHFGLFCPLLGQLFKHTKI